MPCDHPASSLKPDTAEQRNGKVTVRFCCVSCLAPITKVFLVQTPDAIPAVDEGIAALLNMSAPDVPEAANARRGGRTPWRRWEGPGPAPVKPARS